MTLKSGLEVTQSHWNLCHSKLQKLGCGFLLALYSWTSHSTENYIAVTAHYITAEWEIWSYLLECFKYSERHTAENLRDELLRVIREWKLEEKVVAVCTDNAANITAAVKLAKLKHLPCFAHTLNLVVKKRCGNPSCNTDESKSHCGALPSQHSCCREVTIIAAADAAGQLRVASDKRRRHSLEFDVRYVQPDLPTAGTTSSSHCSA